MGQKLPDEWKSDLGEGLIQHAEARMWGTYGKGVMEGYDRNPHHPLPPVRWVTLGSCSTSHLNNILKCDKVKSPKNSVYRDDIHLILEARKRGRDRIDTQTRRATAAFEVFKTKI